MPCMTEWPHETVARQATEIAKDRNQLARVEAMLCGILTTLSDTTQFGAGDDEWFDSFLDRLDYKEIGVTRAELLAWWSHHREKDEKRRQNEREAAEQTAQKLRDQAEKDRLVAAARAKLTPAERQALGL
jgi:hypothetical protein